MAAIRNKFDFDVGRLVKSPCNTCDDKKKFPKCFEKCEILDKVRTKLAEGVSSSYSSHE
jgi:hypothetical protein